MQLSSVRHELYHDAADYTPVHSPMANMKIKICDSLCGAPAAVAHVSPGWLFTRRIIEGPFHFFQEIVKREIHSHQISREVHVFLRMNGLCRKRTTATSDVDLSAGRIQKRGATDDGSGGFLPSLNAQSVSPSHPSTTKEANGQYLGIKRIA